MKKKDLKRLAKQLAEAEHIIQTSEDKTEIYNAKATVYNIGNKVESVEDMLLLDEMVQDFLKENFDK